MGRYWRVPADNRDLNYEVYITEGSPEANAVEDYTSHNTQRLSVEEVKQVLLALPYVQNALADR
jgi:UDP-N-acetylglucosamine 4,6-dehydratase